MSILFFFNDTATTEIYTLSLHDALPISGKENRVRRAPGAPAAQCRGATRRARRRGGRGRRIRDARRHGQGRSEEHTSELQSRLHLVCRLLLEKKNRRRFQF